MIRLWLSLAALLACAWPAPSHAHDPGWSVLTIALAADGGSVQLELGPAEAEALGLDADTGRRLDAELELRLADRVVLLAAEPGQRQPDGGWRLHATFSGVAPQLDVHSRLLARLGDEHKQVVRLLDAEARVRETRILDARRPTASFELHDGADGPPTGQTGAAAVATFAALGAEHVAEGLDHAAFLLTILLGCRRLRTLAVQVSAFTLAHSLTLALAVLGVVELPAWIVESAIAASIVWIAVRNLVGTTSQSERVLAVFGFGLMHGLGFAGNLAPRLASADAGLVPALLGFNLGIELAQLAAVCAAYPIVSWCSRASGRVSALPRLGSAALAGVAMVWLVERVGG